MIEQKVKKNKKSFIKKINLPKNTIISTVENKIVDFSKEEILDPSKWIEIYNQAENLYFIKEYQYCYLKCIELFKNIINLFRSKIGLTDFYDKNSLLLKICEISPNLANIFERIFEIKENFNISDNKEKDLERLISLLNQIFLLIKIQKKTINHPESNIKKNFSYDDTNKIEELDDKFWDELKKAIFYFEKKK